MKKINAFFDSFNDAKVMSRGMWFYQLLAAFLGGIILGILIAPPRKMRVGCNNGNTSVHDSGCCEEDGDCCCGKKED